MMMNEPFDVFFILKVYTINIFFKIKSFRSHILALPKSKTTFVFAKLFREFKHFEFSLNYDIKDV